MQKSIKKLVKKSFKPFVKIKYTKVAIGWATIATIMVASYSFGFFNSKNVNYSFASEKSCIFNPLLLPDAYQVREKSNYSLSHEGIVRIASVKIASSRTCVSLNSNDANQSAVKGFPLGNRVFGQSIKVSLPDKPILSEAKTDNLPTSTVGEYQLKLNTPDKTFSYKVKANNKQSKCENNSDKIVCKLSELQLVQSQKYELEFERYINEQKIETALKTNIKTVDPITIEATTMPSGSLVFDKPKQIILTTNKTLTDNKKVSLINLTGNNEIKIEVIIDKKMLVINILEDLPRETTIQINVEQLLSEDQAFLPSVYASNFTTSGGPKVTGNNISSYGESQYKNFVLNFDSDLLPGQNIGNFVTITGPNGGIQANIKPGAKSVTVSPTSALQRCTNYTIAINKGLLNSYGVESQSAWSASFRTVCQEIFSIGTSVQGRSITAYKFGNGPNKVVFVGATHGDELGSKYLLDSWINELEANYHKIPSTSTVFIVPLLNPDAFAIGSRTNANGVDLNRNFPAYNWKSTVKMPSGETLATGGGVSALSEPESKAIANFITTHSPRLVLTYHSKGSMVIANEAGDSVALAQSYGAKSGYYATKESALGTTFAYDTTGAMENWLYDKKSIPTLLIELKTHTQNEFYRNKSAMWAMIN